jgi:hypothetical protein
MLNCFTLKYSGDQRPQNLYFSNIGKHGTYGNFSHDFVVRLQRSKMPLQTYFYILICAQISRCLLGKQIKSMHNTTDDRWTVLKHDIRSVYSRSAMQPESYELCIIITVVEHILLTNLSTWQPLDDLWLRQIYWAELTDWQWQWWRLTEY